MNATEQSETAVKAAEANAPLRPARRGMALLGMLVLLVSLGSVGFFVLLLLRPQVDPGCRVWLLNHAPDQIAIIDPYRGAIDAAEKKITVTDGLRGLTFSRDGKRCFVYGVVDVVNKLKVLNTATTLEEDTLELSGVPQGIAVFPNDRMIAMILGAKTDFMSGGFDVIDLSERSQANPQMRVSKMRVRDLQLSHKIAVGDDGDRIYMIDAKDSQLFVYSFKQQAKLRTVDLRGAPEDFIYPTQGDFYYVSVLQHLAIYQISKATDEIVGAYVYADMDPRFPFRKPYVRKMAVDASGKFLYATSNERHAVAIWEVGNPEYIASLDSFRIVPDERPYPRIMELPHYLPACRFKITSSYRHDNYVPQPRLIATDPLDELIFVVDEYGALYIYDRRTVFTRQPKSEAEPEDVPVIPAQRMVLALASDTAEVRDIAVSRAVVRGKLTEEGGQ